MNTNQFRLALDRLRPSDWEHFERLSSAFLAAELTGLRMMASPAGDGGRDSELFCPAQQSFIAAQYSVAKDWKKKIRYTRQRLRARFPRIRVLIYLTNQEIGGQADDLKRELLEEKISLDVRDRNWFIDRASSHEQRENAAEELIARIARPYLEGEGVINRTSSPLSSEEARAALLYLGLQWQDDAADRGLTKLSFDALVRAALRHTHSDQRLSRSDIHESVSSAVPSANKDVIAQYVDSALKRLVKKYIRHWPQDDEFCLTYSEHNRIVSRMADVENEESDFRAEVAVIIRKLQNAMDPEECPKQSDLLGRVPRILEKCLLKRGEFFVSSVFSGDLEVLGHYHLKDVIINDLSLYPPSDKGMEHIPQTLAAVVQELLAEGTNATQSYLRRLANSYTLFSFLKETPDVQAATRKLFSYGRVWLDTTVLLRYFAEQLEDGIGEKFTKILAACNAAGIELRVTSGVIQEVSSHMGMGLACASSMAWEGRTPYLYYQYLRTGRRPDDFRVWIDRFRGFARPEDDLAQYMKETASIVREDLMGAARVVDKEMRFAAESYWREAHRQRRGGEDIEESTRERLIRHDLETYLGVIGKRQGEDVTELGYKHWLLTLDRDAWRIRDRLREEFAGRAPQSPLLSLAFLQNSLTFGGNSVIRKRGEAMSMPLLLDIEMAESMPHDILVLANDVRNANRGVPEFVVRRRVRDAIDSARRRGYLAGFGEAQ